MFYTSFLQQVILLLLNRAYVTFNDILCISFDWHHQHQYYLYFYTIISSFIVCVKSLILTDGSQLNVVSAQTLLIFSFNFFCGLQIDSVMSTRLANENDASRRLKSEFLIQFDGVTSNSNDLVIVIGKFYLFIDLFSGT